MGDRGGDFASCFEMKGSGNDYRILAGLESQAWAQVSVSTGNEDFHL